MRELGLRLGYFTHEKRLFYRNVMVLQESTSFSNIWRTIESSNVQIIQLLASHLYSNFHRDLWLYLTP